MDYLLKPIDLEELKAAVDKARGRMDTSVYRQQIETLIRSGVPKQEKILSHYSIYN